MILLAIIFVIAVAGWASFAVATVQRRERIKAAKVDLDSYKRVGQWYEKRVAELEDETRNLALQIVNTTGHPAVAMPQWPSEPPGEYAYDGTGLIRERLDPRDVDSLHG